MKELKCPNCGSTFTVDEAGYASILQQVKTAEFDGEVQRRLAEIRKSDEQARALEFEKQRSESQSALDAKEREIADLSKRIGELSAKYDRLYDDRLDGILSDRKFKEMAERVEAEQNRAEERLAELKETLANTADTRQNLEDFLEIAERYQDVMELDKEMLNRLISTITVGKKIQTGRGSTQEITVNYRFIGAL